MKIFSTLKYNYGQAGATEKGRRQYPRDRGESALERRRNDGGTTEERRRTNAGTAPEKRRGWTTPRLCFHQSPIGFADDASGKATLAPVGQIRRPRLSASSGDGWRKIGQLTHPIALVQRRSSVVPAFFQRSSSVLPAFFQRRSSVVPPSFQRELIAVPARSCEKVPPCTTGNCAGGT